MKSLKKVLALCALMVSAGWVPGSLAADVVGAAASSLGKDALCTKCHGAGEVKPILAIYQTKHGVKGDSRTPNCQSCHGESENHRTSKDTVSPDVLFGAKRGSSGSFTPSDGKVQNASCLACHDKDAKRTHWMGGAHQVADIACASCHQVHAARDKVLTRATQAEVCYTCHKEQRAESLKFSSHPLAEGKMACSDCHNTHGSAGPKLLKKNTVNETCYTCHAEKRGPFLWEHQPVTESCSNCHNPHGSNITPMLKSRSPFLCQECHDGPHNSKVPVAGNAAGTQGGLTSVPSENYTGRGCLNCHSLIHGSNSPAGALLHR